jgi:hypothetical protein
LAERGQFAKRDGGLHSRAFPKNKKPFSKNKKLFPKIKKAVLKIRRDPRVKIMPRESSRVDWQSG